MLFKISLFCNSGIHVQVLGILLISKVLADGFLMIGIDGSEAADGSDWFCYHATSPSIFPVGFCEINMIELTPPRGTNTQLLALLCMLSAYI